MRPEIPAEESLQAAVLQFSDSEKKSVVQANFKVVEVGQLAITVVLGRGAARVAPEPRRVCCWAGRGRRTQWCR